MFLDRDGVLNRALIRDGKPYPPDSLAQLELLPGVNEACRQLHDAGFLLIIVTNQPDISRGTTTADHVEAIHAAITQSLPIDAVQLCPHDDSDECSCRKPKPGMLLNAARDHHIHLPSSFMVGDRWRDIEAGHRAGCHTIWIDAGYNERQPQGAHLRTSGLLQAVPWILNSSLCTEDTIT